MLAWRLLVSALLIPMFFGIFYLDARAGAFAPYFLVVCVLLGWRCVWELIVLLRRKLPEANFALISLCTVAVIVAGWPGIFGPIGTTYEWDGLAGIAIAYMLSVLACTFRSCLAFQGPGRNVESLAIELFIISYVGILIAMTAQLRWVAGAAAGYLVLGSLLIAVKSGDTGAYFVGRMLGRKKMTPRLSPGKTWMGAAGGLLFATLAAVAWLHFAPRAFHADWKPCVWYWSALYGLVIGATGIVGDLGESLIKRDTEHKDAAKLFPGFGGMLDLLDSVIYAGPVAFLLWKFLPLATWQ